MARSSTRQALACRRLTPPAAEARELFAFVGAWVPPAADEVGWGAWDGPRLAGALFAEHAGSAAMLHGPVVVTADPSEREEALEIAGDLLAEAMKHAEAAGIDTLFTRPQGLDRVWVRAGFIPVPEAELPPALRGRPGLGLFAWRGGSALWSAPPRSAPARGRDRRT